MIHCLAWGIIKEIKAVHFQDRFFFSEYLLCATGWISRHGAHKTQLCYELRNYELQEEQRLRSSSSFNVSNFHLKLIPLYFFLQQNYVCLTNWEHIPDGQLQQWPQQPPRGGQGCAAAVQRQQWHHLACHRSTPAKGLYAGPAGVLQRPSVSDPKRSVWSPAHSWESLSLMWDLGGYWVNAMSLGSGRARIAQTTSIVLLFSRGK